MGFVNKKRYILKATDGATAVEFAIIIPVFILLLMGIIEFSLIMYASGVLDGATVAAARAGRTGYPLAGDRAGYVDGILKQRTDGIFESTKVIMASRAYPSYAGVAPLPPCVVDDATCPHDLGSARSVVVYTTSYPWPITTPGLASLIADENGIFLIRSTAIVKNEPWDSGP